jgi:hypothetical protein
LRTLVAADERARVVVRRRERQDRRDRLADLLAHGAEEVV